MMIGHPCTAAEVRQGRAGEKGRGTGGWVGGGALEAQGWSKRESGWGHKKGVQN